MHRRPTLHWLLLCFILGLTALPQPARAATFTVTALGDSGAGSLHEAITPANNALNGDTTLEGARAMYYAA